MASPSAAIGRAGWQRAMIALALSHRARRVIERAPGARQAAERFVGGRTAQAAATTSRRLLERHRLTVSLFYLGEYLDDERLIEQTVVETLGAVDALAEAGLEVHVSVDPTAVGFAHGSQLALDNARRIAERAAEHQGTAMLDMEDLTLVEPTLEMHRQLRQAALPAAITLQARLRRTLADLDGLRLTPTAVRLVKGAFPQPAEHDHQGPRAIDAAYLRAGKAMLGPDARHARFRPVFATHDHRLVEQLAAMAASAGWERDEFEFEMLYRVRPQLQHQLASRGYAVRVYLPFGADWWPYAARRVGENPKNAVRLGRALLTRGSAA